MLSLLSRIKQFRRVGKFCDTVLVSKDGTQFKVHWIVLQSRGVWWTAARDDQHAEDGNICILLPDVETKDVRSFVNELYGGNVDVRATIANPVTILVSGSLPVHAAPLSLPQQLPAQPSSAQQNSRSRSPPPRSPRSPLRSPSSSSRAACPPPRTPSTPPRGCKPSAKAAKYPTEGGKPTAKAAKYPTKVAELLAKVANITSTTSHPSRDFPGDSSSSGQPAPVQVS